MFENILKHLIAQGELHERSVYDFRCFTEYLENQSEYTKEKLQDLVQKINHRTAEPHEKFGAHLIELMRDLGEYGLIPDTLFNLKGGPFDLSDVTKPQKECEKIWSEQHVAVRNTIDVDITQFPVSLQKYYDEYYEEDLFYAWLAFLWQEVEGYRCGLKVMTLEMNSTATFSLNDFAHEFFSAYTDRDQTKTPSYIEPVFHRKLSLVELFKRASLRPNYFNTYKTTGDTLRKAISFVK